MRYIITRDDDPEKTVCFWDESVTDLRFDEDGLWSSESGKAIVAEQEHTTFTNFYKVKIEPGTKALCNIVVHWITEE